VVGVVFDRFLGFRLDGTVATAMLVCSFLNLLDISTAHQLSTLTGLCTDTLQLRCDNCLSYSWSSLSNITLTEHLCRRVQSAQCCKIYDTDYCQCLLALENATTPTMVHKENSGGSFDVVCGIDGTF